jgi:hypothetical protein
VSVQLAMPWGERMPSAVLAYTDGASWWGTLPPEVRAIATRAACSPLVKVQRVRGGLRLVGPVSLVSLKCCAAAWMRWTHRGRSAWEWQPADPAGKAGVSDGR